MVDLYQPFVHDNHYVFVSQALFAAPLVEPEFDCDPRNIRWLDYWLDIHVPGLRKWCFPLFENKTPPAYAPRHSFSLPRLSGLELRADTRNGAHHHDRTVPHADLGRPQLAAQHAEVL